MKKWLVGILSVFTVFSMVACQSGEEQSASGENQSVIESTVQDNRVELTTQNYTQYIDVKASIDVDSFKISETGGVYFVNGEAVLTLTVYPKQPVKCYNVQIQYTNNSPYDTLGIELTLKTTPNLLVPADGNLTQEYEIKIATGDIDTLRTQIVVWGRTKEQMIKNVEQSFNFYMLTDLLAVSGSVVVE